MLEIVIATRNPHKVRELAGLLRVRGIRWRSLAEFPRAHPAREDGRSFEVNAIKKAQAAARATGLPALADDSGVEIDALGGLPGVRSARFAGAHGDDAANIRAVLRAMRQVPTGMRGARYRCALALCDARRVLALTRGSWRVQVAKRPAGRGGFGYDPIMLVPRLKKTVGQMAAAPKQRLSHRAMASRRMQPRLRRLITRR